MFNSFSVLLLCAGIISTSGDAILEPFIGRMISDEIATTMTWDLICGGTGPGVVAACTKYRDTMRHNNPNKTVNILFLEKGDLGLAAHPLTVLDTFPQNLVWDYMMSHRYPGSMASMLAPLYTCGGYGTQWYGLMPQVNPAALREVYPANVIADLTRRNNGQPSYLDEAGAIANVQVVMPEPPTLFNDLAMNITRALDSDEYIFLPGEEAAEIHVNNGYFPRGMWTPCRHLVEKLVDQHYLPASKQRIFLKLKHDVINASRNIKSGQWSVTAIDAQGRNLTYTAKAVIVGFGTVATNFFLTQSGLIPRDPDQLSGRGIVDHAMISALAACNIDPQFNTQSFKMLGNMGVEYLRKTPLNKQLMIDILVNPNIHFHYSPIIPEGNVPVVFLYSLGSHKNPRNYIHHQSRAQDSIVYIASPSYEDMLPTITAYNDHIFGNLSCTRLPRTPENMKSIQKCWGHNELCLAKVGFVRHTCCDNSDHLNPDTFELIGSPGLYVMDLSAMSASMPQNPTRLLMALGLRLGHQLANEHLQEMGSAKTDIPVV